MQSLRSVVWLRTWTSACGQAGGGGEEGTRLRLVHCQSGFYCVTLGNELTRTSGSLETRRHRVPPVWFSLVHRRWGKDSAEGKSPKKVELSSSKLEGGGFLLWGGKRHHRDGDVSVLSLCTWLYECTSVMHQCIWSLFCLYLVQS